MASGAAIGIGTLLAAFGAGLVSFFSPCVAPLIPGYIGYLSGSSLQAEPVKGSNAENSAAVPSVCGRILAGVCGAGRPVGQRR